MTKTPSATFGNSMAATLARPGLEVSFGAGRSSRRALRYRVARAELAALLSTAELLVIDTRPLASSPAEHLSPAPAARTPWRQRFVLFCADAAASRALHGRLLAGEDNGGPLHLRVGEPPLLGAAVVTGEVLAIGGPAADLDLVRRRFLPVGERLVEGSGPRARVRMFLRLGADTAINPKPGQR